MPGCCRGMSMGSADTSIWAFQVHMFEEPETFFPADGPAKEAALDSSFLPTYSYADRERTR